MFNFLERLDQKWGLKGVWRKGRRLGDILNWIAIVFILVIRNCYCYLWQFTHTLWPLFELDFITHLCCKTYIPLLKANWHLIWKIITDTSINFKYSALQKKIENEGASSTVTTGLTRWVATGLTRWVGTREICLRTIDFLFIR